MIQKISSFWDLSPSPLGLSVTGFGHQTSLKRPIRPRSLDCGGLCCLLKGNGIFESQSVKRTPVGPGNVMLLFPGEWHAYGPDTKWEEFWFLFKGPLLAHCRTQGLQPARAIFPNQDPVFWRHLLREALGIIQHDTHDSASRITGVLFSALNELLTRRGNPFPDAGDPMSVIAAQIRAAPEKDWDFKELARDHGMSYVLLRKNFALRFRSAPYHFLLAERMKLAAQQLATGVPPHQVAYTVGMQDPYHFSRLFKKIMGTSPQNFQRFLVSS